MKKDKNEHVAEVADDSGANDDYEVASALAGPPPPPEIFPDVLAEQQSVEQGGEREVTLGDGGPEDGAGSGAASGT